MSDDTVVIRIDTEVRAWIQAHINPQCRTPNAVLRKLAKMPAVDKRAAFKGKQS